MIRQRGGPTVAAVVKHEAEAVPIIPRRVARSSTVHADEARAREFLTTDSSFGSTRPRSHRMDHIVCPNRQTPSVPPALCIKPRRMLTQRQAERVDVLKLELPISQIIGPTWLTSNSADP